MAVYPAGNPGVAPLDPSTLVGQFRLVYGDTHSEPYSPVESGFQNYDELSDDEIESYLVSGSGSISRSIGYYYLSMAGQAAKLAKQIKDYDLQVDTTKRASLLTGIASQWFERADKEDDENGLSDIFDVFDTAPEGEFIPELSLPIWGRRYTIDRF